MEKDEHIGRIISQIYRKGRIFFTKELAEYGLGSGQMMFLFQLYRKDGVTQDELAHILYIDKGTTARALNTLEKQNFIQRVTSEIDKRAKLIYLTDKAKKLQREIETVLESWEGNLTKSLDIDEEKQLKYLLSKVIDNSCLK